MLYVSALAISAKKALGSSVNFHQTSFSVILKQLQLDPETTNMDSVLLCPQDLAGQNKEKFLEAIENGVHPGICIMYMYTKESDAKGLNLKYMKGVNRIKPAEIKKFYQEAWSDFLENKGALDLDISSLQDDKAEEIHVGEDTVKKHDISEVKQSMLTYQEEKESEKVPVPELKLDPIGEDVSKPIYNFEFGDPIKEKIPEPPKEYKRDAMIRNIKSIDDWQLLKEALERDNVTKELITENAEYAGTMQMLDVLDKKIQAIYFDTALNSDQKFEKIRDIGLQKSELRSVSNSQSAQRIIDVIDNITLCAKRVIDERLEGINSAMAKLTADRKALMDTSRLDDAIQERTNMHLELIEMLANLYKLYNTMTGTVTEEIQDLDARLPSDNVFINNMVQPVDSSIFTPVNTSKLASDLMKALQENRITLSAVEDSIRAIINLMYMLYDKDTDLQNHYQEMIHLLKAQNVEDAVIVDCVLKNVLHIYVGAERTGRTSTALIRSGVQARSSNVLLIDFTENPKYEQYGQTTMTLDDFLSQRVEKDFVVVTAGRHLTTEDVAEVMSELKSRLNFYKYINVVVDETDEDVINLLSRDARTINYITDCSMRSIEAMKECVSKMTVSNVGQKLIMIDTPVNPLHIAKAIRVDPTKIKLVMIPQVRTVRACALQKDIPYLHKEVIRIYEEAFR